MTAALLAFGVGLALHLIHLDEVERIPVDPLIHWLRDSTLALPLALIAVSLANLAIARIAGPADLPRHHVRRTVIWATLGGATYAFLTIPGNLAHALLFVGDPAHAHDGSLLEHAGRDALSAFGPSVSALIAAGWVSDAVLGLAGVGRWRRRSSTLVGASRLGRLPDRLTTAVITAAIVAPLSTVPLAAPAQAIEAPAGCGPSNAQRSYEVVAENVIIPFNRWGDVDVHGMVFALEQDAAAVKNWWRPLNTDPSADPAGNRRLRPRPLVLRANVGECVAVTLRNDLDDNQGEGLPDSPRASIHVHGPVYDAMTSDGSMVGFNDDTTVPNRDDPNTSRREDKITYIWTAPAEEGIYFFHDHATLAGSEADGGSNAHGLFGAFVVEPAGSVYRDPVSDLDLYTGTGRQSGELYIDAIIDVPDGAGRDFRESIQLAQDEIPGIGFGFNYGSEPGANREAERCPDCLSEETSLSSWPYGDPALVKLASGTTRAIGVDAAGDAILERVAWLPVQGNDPEDCGLEMMSMPAGVIPSCWTSNVVHAYKGDPTKIRYGMAGVKETHVFHMHAHQWLAEPADVGASGSTPGTPSDTRRPESTTIDSQTFGPGEMFTIDVLFGAGSKNGTIGDSIFHCHLYPHFAEGFWSLFRVHDVREDGTLTTPDGIRVRNIQPLADVPAPPEPTASNPGYPRFIPGQTGWRAPQPPLGVSDPGGTPAIRIVGGQALDPTYLNQVQTISNTAHDVAEVQTISNGSSPGAEVQTISTEGAGGGTFTLTYGAETTGPLAFDANAAAVESALDALTAVGDVAVTGTGTAADPWIATFSATDGNVPNPSAADDFPGAVDVALATTTEGAGGGTFTLTYGAETTGPLAFDANAAAVESALDALTAVGDVAVTGTGTAADPWIATFAMPARNVLALTSVDTFTDASAATTITTVEGGIHAMLAKEASRMTLDGHQPKPGSPFADPCPSGAREVTYNVSVLQRDIVYNEAGWHDTQGRLLVLDEDVDAIVAGTKEPEPLFIRVNAGDCVNFNLTNLLPNWIGNDAFMVTQQTNMVGEHIHLVKFDVLASDGSSNGWNYQEAAFTEDQLEFNRQVIAGTASCTEAGCRLPDPANWDPTYSGIDPGQTIHERWYADYELRTVFTHDHHFPAIDQNRGLFGGLIVEPRGMDFRDPGGVYRQPINDAAHGAVCGTECEGTAAGTRYDIVGPEVADDFREFGLGIQDFVSLVREGGDPQNPDDTFNPPAEPELFPDEDPGVMGVNYRNAPFLLRDTRNGVPVDPAYRFSSWVFGDPETPLLQAYAGDPVRIRLIQGSQEEQHVLMLHGMKWRDEPDDPESPYSNSRALGVSDAFNFEIPEVVCGADDDPCIGDYLYTGAATDDAYLGMWGILRVHGKGTLGLLPLPDNLPQAQNRNALPRANGSPPPRANKPGDPCPAGASKKIFSVVAMEADVRYNDAGDHDPYGLIYALAEDEAAIRSGAKRPEPLVLRASELDCIEVTLTNKLTSTFLQHTGADTSDPEGGDPNLPLEPPRGTRSGLRVSLHPQLLQYDVRGSDGATVGFNRDQTVGPGETILYRWYADDVSPGEVGATNLLDYGDLRGHRHHGLFAGLIIEPRNATYRDPFTGEHLRTGAAADIRIPGKSDFRDQVLFFQDGLNLRDAAGNQLPDPADHTPTLAEPVPGKLDAEDQGEKAFNYRTAMFGRRLGLTPGSLIEGIGADDYAHVFSSTVHGEPETPIFRAYAGDDVRMRILQGSDKPRQHAFNLGGHAWKAQPDDPDSTLISTVGGLSVGRKADLHFTASPFAGDYRYGCGVLFHHLSGGLWGISRVYGAPSLAAPAVFVADPLRTVDDPGQANYHPIMPLELGEVTVAAYDDSNQNGAWGGSEVARAGVPVQLRVASQDGSGAILPNGEATTDSTGTATFQVVAGAYDASVEAPPDWAPTTPAWFRADASDGASAYGAVGLVQLGDVTIRVFDDQNGMGGYEPSGSPPESTLPGWDVSLTIGGVTRTGTTSGDGTYRFAGLKPGTYQAEAVPPTGWTPTQPLPVSVDLPENGSPTVDLGFGVRSGLAVQLFNDSNDNGRRDLNESYLVGWNVAVEGGPDGFAETYSRTTDINGQIWLGDLPPGPYRVTETLKPDWSLDSWMSGTIDLDAAPPVESSSFTCAGASCTGVLLSKTNQTLTIANRNPKVWIVAEPLNDTSNDGVHQSSERGKLIGWTADLWNATETSLVATAITGSSGRATFYVDPATPPGTLNTYVVKFSQPAASDLDWAPTPAQATPPGGAQSVETTVSVIAGETAIAQRGFIQLGTISVQSFFDQDQNQTFDDYESTLSDRTVRLLDAKGKSILAQKATDANGYAAFQVAAGVQYQFEVLPPSGWIATTPTGPNGTGVTKAKVTSASLATQSVEPVMFGQYALSDVVAPPTPVATPGSGTYTSSLNVVLSSESGALIRYTTDGSTPTASSGSVYGAPILVAATVTLKAVAVDAAGNVSGVMVAAYTIDLPSNSAAPASWTILRGSAVSGTVANLAGDDSSYLVIAAARSGRKYYADGYGSVAIAAEERPIVGLTADYDGGASAGGPTRNLYLYDFDTSSWEKLASQSQTAADLASSASPGGDPDRFVSASGEVRFRVEAVHGSAFQLKADWMRLTWHFDPAPTGG